MKLIGAIEPVKRQIRAESPYSPKGIVFQREGHAQADDSYPSGRINLVLVGSICFRFTLCGSDHDIPADIIKTETDPGRAGSRHLHGSTSSPIIVAAALQAMSVVKEALKDKLI